MTAKVFVEPIHPMAFMVSEADGHRSRDVVSYALNVAISVAMVLGAAVVPAAATTAASADAENTGNGTLTMDATAPVTGAVKNGDYRVVFTSATAFNVTDPNGKDIGKGAVGTAFAKELKFNIAAGATAFAANDAFTIRVGVEGIKDELFGPLDPAATDGRQIARAIAGYPVSANPLTNPSGLVVNKDCEVVASTLVWPAGISAAAKAEAIEQLASRGIKLR